MLSVLAPTMPRKPKAKREEVKVNYRLDPAVKAAVFNSSEIARRSENLQAEHLLKIGYLHTRGLNIYGMSEIQIIEKFEEMRQELLEDKDND